MVRKQLAVVCLFALTISACAPAPEPVKKEPADAKVMGLADTYLAAYFERYPEQVTYYGVPGRRHDRLTDNSLDALKTWEVREDRMLAEARGIDPSSIEQTPLKAT